MNCDDPRHYITKLNKPTYLKDYCIVYASTSFSLPFLLLRNRNRNVQLSNFRLPKTVVDIFTRIQISFFNFSFVVEEKLHLRKILENPPISRCRSSGSFLFSLLSSIAKSNCANTFCTHYLKIATHIQRGGKCSRRTFSIEFEYDFALFIKCSVVVCWAFPFFVTHVKKFASKNS